VKRVLGTPVTEYLPALGLLAFTAVYLGTAYTYSPDARAVPAGVAWVALVLAVLDIVSRTRTKLGLALMHWLNPAGDPGKDEARPHYPALKQLSAVLWMALFVVLMVLLGILYSVPLYVFGSLWLRGRRALWLSAGVAAGATLMIWVLFDLVLQLELYPGVLFSDV
jgi:hypothetical protein